MVRTWMEESGGSILKSSHIMSGMEWSERIMSNFHIRFVSLGYSNTWDVLFLRYLLLVASVLSGSFKISQINAFYLSHSLLLSMMRKSTIRETQIVDS